ncbi:MAG: hypothetical protein ABIJ65_02455 [Chloroflexota bacterium]
MQKSRPFWYLLDIYGWVVFSMSIVTAIIIDQPWVVLLGFIGYLIALLVDLTGGRALGRTGAIRLAQAEQENRELHAEQARLLGAIRERDEKISTYSVQQANDNESNERVNK